MESGQAFDEFSESDKALLSYLQSALEIDFSALYKKALASQVKPITTPTQSSSPELLSKSVDD